MDLLEGSRGIILGVANRRSLAWAIGQRLAAAGARLYFNYQSERVKDRVEKLLSTIDSAGAGPCDVTDDAQLDRFFQEAGTALEGPIDFLVHAVAFARMEDLEGAFVDTSREGFKLALEVSAYSLPAVCQRAVKLMEGGGSVMALTYLGAQRAVPSYNVMGVAKSALESSIRYLAADLGPRGIRVNGISAGPVRTLSAKGISGFSEMYAHHAERAPLRKHTDPEEVADAALFFASSLSRGITGEILYVDGGYHITGL